MEIRLLRAALVHDYLYIEKTRSRKEADEIFYEAMIVSRMPKFKAYLFYKVVRWFGRHIWNKGLKKLKKIGSNSIDLPRK